VGRLTRWQDRTPASASSSAGRCRRSATFSLIRYGKANGAVVSFVGRAKLAKRRSVPAFAVIAGTRCALCPPYKLEDDMNEDTFNMSVRKFLKKGRA
jgi:predicted TIM-barrel enzyme